MCGQLSPNDGRGRSSLEGPSIKAQSGLCGTVVTVLASVVADAIMERCKCLFGVVAVVLLACDVTAWHQWAPPVEKAQPQHPWQQPDVPPPTDLFDKCRVEEGQKIRCGPQDVTAEECDQISCCFDGSQCYYGKAGECWRRLLGGARARRV